MSIFSPSKFVSIVVLLFSLQFLGLPSAASADNSVRPDGKVVMVIVDRVSWADLRNAEMPFLKQLISDGAIGLMNTNAAAGTTRTPENTYATIGAGAKIRGGTFTGTAFNAFEIYDYETAGQVFFRRTGIQPADDQVIHLGIAQIDKTNMNLKYRYIPGAIGTILHQNGLKTAVIGNADVPGGDKSHSRQAVAIAMDNKGVVDFGNVSPHTYVFDPNSIARVKTNYTGLLEEFEQVKQKAGFVVIETGDTSRIDDMREFATNEVVAKQTNDALAGIDGFLEAIRRTLDFQKDLLMVVVPSPSSSSLENDSLLTPFIIAGKDIGSGFVWSGTAKREGLISNTDLAVTVLNHFGLERIVTSGLKEPISLSGQVIKSHLSADAAAQILEIEQDTLFLHVSRSPLLKIYLNFSLLVIFAAFFAIWLKFRYMTFFVPLLAAISVVPGVMLWGNYFPQTSIVVSAVTIYLSVAVLTALLHILTRQRPADFYLVVSGLTMLMLIVDLAAGAPLGKTSPFSYDALAGARFYGIGNEYMGVLIGSALVFAGTVMDKYKNRIKHLRIILLLLFVLCSCFIAAPNFGTNVGGFIASVAGFGAAALILFRDKISKKVVLAALGTLAAVVLGFVTYDLSREAETQSHIGRTITLIGQSGTEEIGNIVSRKWAVNVRLIKYSTWSWIYFTSILAVFSLKKKFASPAQELAKQQPWFDGLLPAVLLGSAAAMLFNDSGIVAAANMIVYPAAAYLTGFIGIIKREGAHR